MGFVIVSVVMAMANKLDGIKSPVYCIVGDGEINEGSAWESIMIAAHHQLSNFVLIVDANSFQAMGVCTEVLNMESFKAKFEAFNFETMECDGHDVMALESAFNGLKNSPSQKPKALIARTIKGKGVSFMENNNMWHYTRLTKETYQNAMNEINK